MDRQTDSPDGWMDRQMDRQTAQMDGRTDSPDGWADRQTDIALS